MIWILLKENLLTQELYNKEIMFIRLQNKEQECDDLKRKVVLAIVYL
jgi:hypothetical protein